MKYGRGSAILLRSFLARLAEHLADLWKVSQLGQIGRTIKVHRALHTAGMLGVRGPGIEIVLRSRDGEQGDQVPARRVADGPNAFRIDLEPFRVVTQPADRRLAIVQVLRPARPV